MEANVYSGDSNRVRDRSKDFAVEVDGVEVATIYGDTNPPQVVWRVYGPQDADRAAKVGEAIAKAARAVLAGDSTPSASPAPAAAGGEGKKRNYTKAIREEIAAGKSDDEIWAILQSELALRGDQRYRIKEVRKEAEKTAASVAGLTDTLGKLMDVPVNTGAQTPPEKGKDPWIEHMLNKPGVAPGPVDVVAAGDGVGKSVVAPNLEAFLNS